MKRCNAALSFWFLFLFVILGSGPSFGQWGKALHFSWWQHDRVLIPDAPSLFPFVLNAGTIEMWFKPDSLFTATSHTPDYTYLFSKNLSGNVQGDVGIGWKRDDGDIQCFIQDGVLTQDVYPQIKAWEPRWYHIAFVWDTNDSMRVFIDGKRSADIEPNSAGEVCLPVYGGTQKIVIGSGSIDLLDQRYETFRGSIDEVRISAISRYKKDFAVATTPFAPDAYTIALWHFDEGSGTSTVDATGNGFNGILGRTDTTAGYAAPEWISVVKDPKIVINEVNVDPADGLAGDANGDGVRDALADQFIELLNITATAQDLSGWKVGDNSGLNFTFPQGYTLPAGTFVTVFGGGNVSNVEGYNADPLKTRVFTAGSSLGDGLSLTGDYVILKSTDGNNDCYLAYGDKYNAGAPSGAGANGIAWEFMDKTQAIANNNNSITRSPDGAYQGTDVFVQHNTVSSLQFSPNKTTGGYTTLSFPLVVNINPANGGTVLIEPKLDVYPAGTVVKLTATPADKYIFQGWSGSVKEVVSSIALTMNGPKTIDLNFSPQFRVTPRLIINEVNADPKNDPILGDANGDGVVSSIQDEFVEFVNISNEPFDLSGYKFGDDEMITFTFPNGYIVPPKGFVTVFGGGNVQKVPGYNLNPLLTKVFIADSVGVGNGLANGGDFVVLFSPDGKYDMYFGYNSKFNAGPPTSDVVAGVEFEIMQETAANGQDDNSMTRSPDGNISIGDPFVEHKSVSDKLFSPNQTINGGSALTVKDNLFSGAPEKFSLSRNYPNPFNPSTVISFDVPNRSKVTLKVYSVHGKEIATLVNRDYAPGSYHAVWNGKSDNGEPVSSGVYIYRLVSGNFQQAGKMMLLK